MNKFSGDAKLNPVLHNLKEVRTKEFRRPNHTDFQTTTELKALKFSGMRSNTIARCFEIWVVGEVVGIVTYDEVKLDPLAVTKAMVKQFDVL